jgi:hypothetical protein
MEQRGAAERTEAEAESRALVAGAHVFRGLAGDAKGLGKTRQGRKHAAGAPLAGKAMAYADAKRLAFDIDAQLPTGARCCSWHGSPRH